RALPDADRQHVAGDAEVLDRARQGERVRGHDADVAVELDEGLRIEVLRVDDRRQGVREDLELGRDTHVVAGGRHAAGNDAAPRRPSPVKELPYESGMPPLGDARERFSVKFYLVAMLFIVFDIETVFLFPWATIFRDGGAPGTGAGFLLVEMLVFILILAVGYI